MLRLSLFAVFCFAFLSLAVSCEYHEMLKRLLNRERMVQTSFERPVQTPVGRTVPLIGSQLSIPRQNFNRRRISIPASNTRYYSSTNLYRPAFQHGSNYYGSQMICPDGSRCYNGDRCFREHNNQIRTVIYKCVPRGTCGEGYVRVNLTDKQYSCQDINECNDDQLNTCEQNCNNYQGYFRCSCEPGFILQSNNSCIDEDECANSRRRCQHECINTEGSYHCSCPEGYEIYKNIFCKDIDECENATICPENQQCLNTYGGYQCYAPSDCEEGYHKSTENQNSNGVCVIDEMPQNINVPITITEWKIPLKRNLQRWSKILTITWSGSVYGSSRSSFILEGQQYFRVYKDYFGRDNIQLFQSLTIPGEYVLKIAVEQPRFGSRSIRSWIVVTFIVSEYDF